MISIARDGVEIGSWTESEVRAFIRDGSLVGTDFYWKEGMADWRPLTGLIPPNPPKPVTKKEPWEIPIPDKV